MYLSQAFKMAIKSILSNKIRSMLTMLGVIIGVGAVIAAIGFAQGSTKSVTDSIESLGTNLISVSIRGRNSNRTISYNEIEEFAEINNSIISNVSPNLTGNKTIKNGVNNKSTSILGTNEAYQSLRNLEIESGRFITKLDVDFRKNVAVIGTVILNDIFNGENPLGKKFKIDGISFTVIGVIKELEGSQDQSSDDRVIIPVTIAQRLLKSSSIDNFTLQAKTTEDVDSVMSKLENFLLDKFKTEDSFRIINQAQILSTLGNITGIMMAILGGIATISLVVGGIGIMNIMLVSVTERTREIGIRKSLGAKRKDILIQFLIEALMVTGIGGVIGILIGVGIIKFVLGGLNLVPEVYSVEWIVGAFLISLFEGVVFGMFPAYKAAKLKPIDALRYE